MAPEPCSLPELDPLLDPEPMCGQGSPLRGAVFRVLVGEAALELWVGVAALPDEALEAGELPDELDAAAAPAMPATALPPSAPATIVAPSSLEMVMFKAPVMEGKT